MAASSAAQCQRFVSLCTQKNQMKPADDNILEFFTFSGRLTSSAQATIYVRVSSPRTLKLNENWKSFFRVRLFS